MKNSPHPILPQMPTGNVEKAADLTACLSLFLLKAESRNQWNQKRKKYQFQRNYKRLFGFAMPRGDSVNDVISRPDEEQVEWLKQQMVRALSERKVFRSGRHRGKWYSIAIDGSGVVSFDHQHCDQCLHKTSKKGKVTYSHQVPDARLVTPNGFSVSVATVWQEVHALRPLQAGQQRTEIRYEPGRHGQTTIRREYEWVTDPDYQGYTLHRVSCRETITRPKRQPDGTLIDVQTQNCFVHITSLPVGHSNVVQTSQTARLRWKVENEGFNTLKNGGTGYNTNGHAKITVR